MIVKNKKVVMILITVLLVAAFSFFVSAAEVCCEKTNSGAWCQLTDSTECDSDFSQAATSCSQTLFCQKGTCVNENSGTCTPNTPKGLCETEGVWHNEDKDEIPECRSGCCILGQEVAFVNEPACQQLATDYGVNVNFRPDINSQGGCFTLDTTVKEGACVLESDEGTDCKRTTQSGCVQLNGVFNKGLLCTAQGLSDCAKSKETIIEEDKVYFKDTCGNLANIYDEARFVIADYWKEIQDPECEVNGVPSSTCGDCSYRLGTIGAKYKSGDESMPNSAPKYGNNVCKDLSCFYDTNNDNSIDTVNEKYKHGESWCAESEGTKYHVPFIMDSLTKKNLSEGYNDYNLPGSRYYKLKCYDGEVIVEPCKEFRNSICKEAIDPNTDKKTAACFINEGATCFSHNTKDSCGKITNCKWVPGYTLDGAVVGDGEINGSKLEEYNNKQGACYPIFAPGITFWSGDGEDYCIKMNGVVEKALFETGILQQRENFADDSIKEATNLCIDGCYAIPGYGSKDGTDYFEVDDLKEFQLGDGTLGSKTQDSYLSKREGYYCKKKVDEPDVIDNTKTGKEKGADTGCASDDEKDLSLRRVKPFYTHKQWLETIRERTRSIGDCGYKSHAFSENIFTEKGKKAGTGWPGDPNSEKITVIFEVLEQDKEVKKSVGEKIVLYKGDETTPNPEYRGEF